MGISGLFSGSSKPKSDGLVKAVSIPAARKSKRDPSVSGIASLFGDDDEDDEEPDLKTKDSGVKEAEIHEDLRNQIDTVKTKANGLSMKLDLEKTRKEDLERKIKELMSVRNALAESKHALARQTAVEMDRMRHVILS